MNETYIPDFDEMSISIDISELPKQGSPVELDNSDDNVDQIDPVIETAQDDNTTAESTYAQGSDPNAITFFTELKDRNYLNEDPNKPFDGTWESLEEHFNNLPQRVLNDVVEQLPELSKDVMRFIAEAGDNITKDELKNFFKTYFEDLDQEPTTVETIDSAREYLEQVYKNQGIKPTLISVMLDKLEDDDSILDEAKAEMEKQSNKTRKVDELITNKSQENNQIKEQQLKFVQDISNELKSSGWKNERIDKVQNILKGQEFNNTLRDIVANPKALVQLADIITYYSKTNKTFDLTAFQKQFDTKGVISLKDKLEKNQFSSSSTASTVSLPNSNKKYDSMVPVFD